ncbi:MAG: Arc family DNA-binding protein [Acidimicrobiia bacterium]|nr:Arc family DNA-binding protein [Acidimicrobiia bacterium]
MAERKSFLVRMDGEILEQVRRWADDDLRSLNGQIEFLLRKALVESGRLRKEKIKPGGKS